MTERDSEIGKTSQSNQVSEAAQRPNQQIISAFANILQKYGTSKNQNQNNNNASNRIVIDDQNEVETIEEDHIEVRQFNNSNKEEKQDKNNDYIQEQVEQDIVNQKISYSPEKKSLNKQLCKKSTKGGPFQRNPSAEQKGEIQNIQTEEKAVQEKHDIQENAQIINSSPQKQNEEEIVQFIEQLDQNTNQIKSKQKQNDKGSPKNQIKSKQTKSKAKPKSSNQYSEVKPIIEIMQDMTIQKEILNLGKNIKKNQNEQKDMIEVKFVVEVYLLPGESTGTSAKSINSLKSINLQVNKKVNQVTKNNPKSNQNVSIPKSTANDNFGLKQLQKNLKPSQKIQQKKRFIQNQQLNNIQITPKLQNIVNKPQNTLFKPQSTLSKNKVQAKSKVVENEIVPKKQMSNFVPKLQRVTVNVRMDKFKTRDEPINTGSATLNDLVRYLFEKKIITEALCSEFVGHHSMTDVKDFLSKFQSGKLHKFDFNKFKFTILDHRRLAQLLSTLHPENFFIGNCYHVDTSVLDFLTNLYDLTAEEYFNLYTKIDKISGIKWWSKILVAQDERLMETSKQRRIAKRKADQAAQAVKQVVSNAQRQLNKSNVNSFKDTQNQDDQYNNQVQKKQTTMSREKEKQKRREQQSQIAKIRQMVSTNFGKKGQNQGVPPVDQSMRKKIKFY